MQQVKGAAGGDGALGECARGAGGAPQGGGDMFAMPPGAGPAKTELRCQTYSVNELCGLLTPGIPRQPESYYTFSETHSYGPDMLEIHARLDAKAKTTKK